MSVTIGVAMAGQHPTPDWFALVLLGNGWHFLFVAGTTRRVQTYRPSERFRAQAINDFSGFAMVAGALLVAGTVLFVFGWTTVLLSSLPALILGLRALAWKRRRLPAAKVSA